MRTQNSDVYFKTTTAQHESKLWTLARNDDDEEEEALFNVKLEAFDNSSQINEADCTTDFTEVIEEFLEEEEEEEEEEDEVIEEEVEVILENPDEQVSTTSNPLTIKPKTKSKNKW